VFGGFALADGVANIVRAIGGREADENWWIVLLSGIVAAAVGILTLFHPQITTLVLLTYIAIWAIATGLLEIITAIRLRRVIEGEFWLGLAGLISVAFGVFILARPGEGALSLLWLIGAFAIVFGLALVVAAFETRGFLKAVRVREEH
jgi:uncharacterized membrane protein HdeD (DUF308 family)